MGPTSMGGVVMTSCRHPLCELIGGACSLATGRSRGCRPGLASRVIAPEVFEEVRAVLAALDPAGGDERVHAAAVRPAEIIRREAREDRHVLALARIDEPELAATLARFCRRRT